MYNGAVFYDNSNPDCYVRVSHYDKYHRYADIQNIFHFQTMTKKTLKVIMKYFYKHGI